MKNSLKRIISTIVALTMTILMMSDGLLFGQQVRAEADHELTTEEKEILDEFSSSLKDDETYEIVGMEYFSGYLSGTPTISLPTTYNDISITSVRDDVKVSNLNSHIAEIDKIYDALQRGEGGKTFTSKTHCGTIRKGKLCVTSV